MSVSPTPPRVAHDTPPAAASGSAVAGAHLIAPGLGDRLKQIVKLYGSQQKAAAYIGRTPESLQNWIKGGTVGAFDAIASLALGRGVSLSWLATGHGDMYSGISELATACAELPNHLQARVRASVLLLSNAHRQHTAQIDAILRATLELPQ